MAASTRKFLLLAKPEVTQFTDSVPVAGTNDILVTNLTTTPLRVDTEDRGLVRSYLGGSEKLVVMEESVVEFDVEIAGSGAAGTAPKWGPLMKGSGFSETIAAAVSVTYAPISTAFVYLTLYAYNGLHLFKLLGAVGSMSWNFGAKRIPRMHFRFVGKYSPVTDVAMPGTATYTGWTTPVASIPATAGTMTVGGYAAKLAEFTGDTGVSAAHALWINQETIDVQDRAVTGSLTYEAVTVAAKDYFAALRTGTTQALVYTHGVVAGNIVTLNAPKAQLTDIGEVDFNGFRAFRSGLSIVPNAGNDELTVVAT